MPENITNNAEELTASTDTDSELRDSISREEEEEKKRLADQREQEVLISKDSLNRDNSEISEQEKHEPRIVQGDDEILVENFGGNGTTFSFSSSNLEITLQEDGAILKHEKGNPENGYLISTNEEIIEYDFSNFDVSQLEKEEHAINFTKTIAGEFDFEVEFNIDKEGNIEIESVRGDAAGKINFKDGDKTYTLDKDGQLVELAEQNKELDKEGEKDTEEQEKLEATLEGEGQERTTNYAATVIADRAENQSRFRS